MFRAAMLLVCLAFCNPMQGEIQRVLVHWRGLTCNQTCLQSIVQKYLATPGVATVTMSPAAQTVELRWNPTVPFTYQAVKFAMQSVGPGIDDLRVKVRGLIQYRNNQFWIISMGDNTPFALVGPTVGQPGGMTQYHTPSYHPLSPQTQAALAQGMQQARVAIIEGQLLLPERSPPLMLIVANLQFVQPEQATQ